MRCCGNSGPLKEQEAGRDWAWKKSNVSFFNNQTGAERRRCEGRGDERRRSRKETLTELTLNQNKSLDQEEMWCKEMKGGGKKVSTKRKESYGVTEMVWLKLETDRDPDSRMDWSSWAKEWEKCLQQRLREEREPVETRRGKATSEKSSQELLLLFTSCLWC